MKQGPIPMTCMARNSDEIGAQVPASTGDHTKNVLFQTKKISFYDWKIMYLLTTLHVFKKYACEKSVQELP